MAKLNPNVYIQEIDRSFLPQKEDLIKGAWQAFCENDTDRLEYIFSCDKTFTKPVVKLEKGSIAAFARVFPELIAEQLVGVQPMAAPVGLAYALRYKYKSEPEPCPPNAISGAWKDFCAGRSTKFWSDQDRDNVKRYRTSFGREDFKMPE